MHSTRVGKYFLALSLAALLAPATASAGYYVLPAAADSYLKEAAPLETHGGDEELFVKLKSGDNLQSVFRFDVSSIPAEETVVNASVVLYVTKSDNESVHIYRITNSWTESAANWNNLGDRYDAGACYGEFVPAVAGQIAVDVTALVRNWVEGTHLNFGFMLVAEANDKESGYASRESAEPGWQPQLYVTTSELPAMRVASGSYLGDGTTPRPIAGLGFRPDLVLVKGNNSTATVAKTSTMFGDESKELGPGSALLDNNILSFDADGFIVGSDDRVNQSGILFYWVAFQAAPGEMVVGSYLGDGSDDRDIIGIGFEPEHLVVMAETNEKAMQRFADEPVDDSQEFEKADPKANRIQAFLPNGFQIGSHNTVNEDRVTYHYVAWHATPGVVESSSYPGNGVDNRAITGVGFEPDFVFLAVESNAYEPLERMESMSGDLSFRVNTGTGLDDLIQAFLPDGFEVGTSDGVNASSERYYWTAFHDHLIDEADLELAAAVDDSLPNESDTINVTLTLANAGPVDATGIEVTGLLPPGLTYVTHSTTQGTYNSGSGVWSVGGVENGLTAELKITATVDPGTGGTTIAWESKITASDQNDPDETDNSASVSVRVQGVDVVVAKDVDNGFPNEGDAISYSIVLTNAGPDSATAVEVMDALPAGVTYVSDTPTQGVYSSATGLWTVGAIAAGDTARLAIDATVDAGTGGATITNTAQLVSADQADLFAGNDTASADITVQSVDLSLHKYVDDPTPVETDVVTFTVRLTNSGPDSATGIEVTDLVPAGLTYSYHSTTRGSYDDVTGLWDVGTVAVLDTVTLSLSASVDLGTSGRMINNLAVVTAVDQADVDLADNSAFAKVTVQGSQFLMATGQYTGDGALTRSITGVGFQPDVVIVEGDDGEPATVRSSSMSGTDSKKLAWNTPMSTNVITSLDADGFTVSPDGWMNQSGSEYYWVAFKTAPDVMISGSYVGDGADNREVSGLGFMPDYVMILPQLYKEATQRFPAQAGDASIAFGYGDEIPDCIQSFTSDGFDVGADSLVNAPDVTYHYVAWQAVPAVTVGGSYLGQATAPYDVTGLGLQPEYVIVKQTTSAEGTVHRPASLAGDQTLNVRNGSMFVQGIQAMLPDGFRVGSDGSVNQPAADYLYMAFRARVAPQADLEVTMTASDTVPIEGDTLVYTTTLRNRGPDAADDLEMVDMLPAGVTYLSDAPSQGTYTSATGVWDVGAVLSGDSATLDLSAVVDAGMLDSTIVNAATVAAVNQADPDTTNNSAGVAVTVGPSTFRVVSGTYVGDGGVGQAITGVGFAPDVVVVKGNTTETPVIRTSSVNGNQSKPLGAKAGFIGNLVESLDADGFTVGGSGRVNRAGVTYYWTAFRAARPELVVGSYVGDGADDRSIAVGFEPGYVIVMNEAVQDAVQRFAAQVGDASLLFSSEAPLSNRIQAFEADGFQVGSDPATNASGDTIHYIAWKAVPDRAESGSYVGNGSDDRDITANGFNPNFLLVQRNESGSAGVFRSIAVPGDNTLPVAPVGLFSDRIQTFLPDGFQVGTSPEVNDSANTYFWIAFKDDQFLDIAVGNSVDDPTPNVGEVVEFTITVVNNGPADASGVRIVDLLPAGLTYDSDSPTSGTYDSTTGVWDVGALPAGVGADLRLRATVDPGTGGSTIVNTAALGLVDQTDLNGANDSSDASVTVQSADLAVTVNVDQPYPVEGDTIRYTIRLSNGGPDDATGVSAFDPLPTGVTYLADSTSQGLYDTTTGAWNVGAVASGEADTLWIDARIDAGTFGSYITNAASVAGSDVADPDGSNDADSVTVLVPTPVALDDVAGSSFPTSAFAGESNVALRIGVDNVWDVGVTLDTLSTISFTDGIRIYMAALANPTYVPPGATDFTLSFAEHDVPGTFTADSTYGFTLELTGVTSETLPYNQTIATTGTNAIFIDQSKMSVDAPLIGEVAAHPGEPDVPLLVLRFDNGYSEDRTLDTLTVTNDASGAGTQTQLDASTPMVKLWDDVDGSLSLSGGDTLLAASVFMGGRAEFGAAVGWTIPALGERALIVAADVDSLVARDGDRLDAKVETHTDIVFSEPTVFDREISPLYPLDSYGAVTVDGMVAHQIAMVSVPTDTLFSGDVAAAVMAVVIPTNGYQPDTLTSLNVRDYSGGFDPADFDRVTLFRDDGDRMFDPGLDTLLGEMAFSGDRYEITGLSTPVGPGVTYFVAVDVAISPTNGNTFQPGIPVDGLNVVSGNDGPIDVDVASSTVFPVVKVEKIDVTALPLSDSRPRPGDVDVPLLFIEVRNNSLQSVTLDSLRLANVTAGPGTQSELDGQIAAVNLFADDGNGTVDSWDTIVAQDFAFFAGTLTARDLALSLDPGEASALLVAVNVDSTCVRDSDVLGVRIPLAGDLFFDVAVPVAGAFPIETNADRSLDGMMSFQIDVYPSSDSTVIVGTTDILVLDLAVPANGYDVDTLTSIEIENLGTATDAFIETMNLWADGGNGTFDEGGGDDVWLATLVPFERRRFQRSGLALPLLQTCADGTRFFVSCDLTSGYTDGASFQFGVPVKGLGVASGDDGPIDEGVVDPTFRLLPSPDELTVFPYPVGDHRVHPGSKNVLNFGIGFYNGFASSVTLDGIILDEAPGADHADLEWVRAFADADTNGLFDPDIDVQLAEIAAKDFTYDLSPLDLKLPSERITYLFVAYDLKLDARDSVTVDFQLSSLADISVAEIADNLEKSDKISGDFPIDSPGEDLTDGMIAEQIDLQAAPPDRPVPGDQHVLAMGFTIPANGSLPDQLNFLTALNAGTAAAGQDIDELNLWAEDGGDPTAFDPGDDRLMATMVWSGSGWSNPIGLTEAIPAGGLKCYVTFSTALTANDNRTFQAVLPVGGIVVQSGNDGPLDLPVTNPNEQTISTDPLITTLWTDRSSYSTSQQVVLSMRVRNEGADSLLGVTAPPPSLVGSGAATYVDGPAPAIVDITSGSDTTLVWHYTATTAGSLQFCGFAHDGDSIEVSTPTCTPELEIQDKPSEIAVALEDVTPIAVNRGQSNVEAIALDLKFSIFGQYTAPVDLEGVEISIQDGTGTPIAPNSVLSEITIVSSTGSNEPFAVADSISNPLHLFASEPIRVAPGDSITLDFTVDIAPAAALSPFRLAIQSAAAIHVVDANDGAGVALTTSATFPWNTNPVDVEIAADSLLVSAGGSGMFFVNTGQEQVEVFRFTLLNNGTPQTANEILRAVALSFYDTTGAPIAPDDVIRNLTLTSGGAELYFDDAVPSVGNEITCDLSNTLLLPPQVARDVSVVADLRAFPLHGGFRVAIDAPSAITARDNNDGGLVVVTAAAPAVFPIESPALVFQQPATGLTTALTSLVPTNVLPLTDNVPLIEVVFSHADSAASSIVVDSLAMAFVDESGAPLFPGDYFSQLSVIHAGDTLAELTSLSSVSHVVEARLDPQVTLAPQQTDSFRLYLSSKSLYSPAVFQVRIDREHLVACDVNTGERITSITGSFPFFSDPSSLQLPGSGVSCAIVSLLPPNVAGNEVDLDAFEFVVRNDNPIGYTPSQLSGLTVRMETWKGAPLDPTDIVTDAALSLGDTVITATDLNASFITFDLPDSALIVYPSAADTLVLSVDVDASGEQTFRFVIADTADVLVRDVVTGDTLSAATIGNVGYPLATTSAHVLGTAGDNAFTNYPNPFAAGRQSTRITFFLDEPSRVTLKLYTLWGAPVRTLIDGETRPAGLHQDVTWSGHTGDGDVVNNGVYYLVLDVERAGSGSTTTFKRKVGVVR